jgi:class I fructose-bisphosphate aldolase
MKTEKNISEILGEKADYYLDHVCEKITKDELQTPSKNSLETVFCNSNRNPQVLRSLAQLYNRGNLGDTGYLSILPVDQGIEHSAAFSFYKTQIILTQKTL